MRLYTVLLRLYPASFRAEYGDELRAVFRRRLRHAPGARARAGVWLVETADLLKSAVQVHGDLLGQDLRGAARTLLRARGFAATAVLVTAVGVGGNTAVLSVADRVLVRPLPFPGAERLVGLWESVPQYTRLEPSPANYRDWKRMTTAFATMGAYGTTSLNLVGEGEPQRLEGAAVTADLLPLLGIEPERGRLFRPEDDRGGAAGTVVLSHGLWESRFGGAPDVLGRHVRLDDETYEVVGVMPPGFGFPSRRTQLWTALRLAGPDFEDRDNNYLRVVARLRRGISLAEARAELRVVAGRLEREYPKANAHTRVNLRRLRDEVSPQARLLLAALVGASLCLLLLACANLASLLLARGLARRHELALRAALGAGRDRLARQLMTESLLLAVVGGAVGVLLAAGAAPLLSRLVPVSLPLGEPSRLDGRMLAFAALLTGLSGVGFGLLPALRAGAGGGLRLRPGTRGTPGGRERARSVLIVAEVAAAVALVIASGLLGRALWRVEAADPGFDTRGVLTLQTPLPGGRYNETDRRARLYERVVGDLRARPGVEGAAYISFLPMTMRGGIWPVVVPGADADPERSYTASLRFVTPGFFDALGIPRRRGRDVAPSDTLETPLVAVVSESFAKRYWPGQDPLGRVFRFAFAERQVVGVVGDVRVRGLERASEPQVYLPYKQVEDGALPFYEPKDLVVRSTSAPEALLPAVRKIVRAADPELPIDRVRTLEEVVAEDTAPRRTQLRVLVGFAAVALLLAGLGIHGLLAYDVSQRIPEIGVRMALGALPARILRMVLGSGLALAAGGIALGLVVAYAAGTAMPGLLAGVKPTDLVTYGAGVAVALATALSGGLVPALRALRVDPATTLREP
jgi:predicted permease